MRIVIKDAWGACMTGVSSASARSSTARLECALRQRNGGEGRGERAPPRSRVANEQDTDRHRMEMGWDSES